MGTLRIPVDVNLHQTALGERLARQEPDRRAFLKAAAALGLSVPALLGGGSNVLAQESDTESTPEGAYTGGHGNEHGTGDSTPVPSTPTEHVVYDPFLPAVEAGPKAITISAVDATVFVAKDTPYAGWTWDGTIPGPIHRVVQGDEVTVTVRNDGAITHSLDYHSAKTPPNVNYRSVAPGEEFTWSFTATTPGAYMYHCGTAPVLMHIGAGMYGAMIVDPAEGWAPAQELCFVQSEFYFEDDDAKIMVPSMAKMMLASGVMMDLVTFNGYANQYVENPIKIKVGEPVRIFVVNAGPNVWCSFHVVGAIFDKAFVNANPANPLYGLQGISIGPGDGACVEFTVEEPGEYLAVNHAFGHATHGAVAILKAE
ncbi:MAG TPA: multicopper oxidase domain-containing protein [Thermomicrobiales bacterium]|nr:multicopper oxidase domain-containing protein [Thermomicrobiales bacterium]